MGLLTEIDLTLNTLLVFFLIPFVHLGINLQVADLGGIRKKFNYIAQFILVILGAFVVAKLVVIISMGEFESIKLAMLHLAPLALSFLQIHYQQIGLGLAGHMITGTSSYNPEPLNTKVERLSWDDLVIEDDLKEELLSVITLLKDPNTATQYGIDIPKGILLSGPPGTGKTTVAKVIANTAKLSFFVLKLDEVISQWVGESEKNLSRLFQAAQAYAPAVIFIDEVDSIGKQRSGKQQWADNLLNHLLQLIDGVIRTKGLYVIAATNRPDLVDSALKRPGRLSKVIELPLPNFQARKQLFKLYLSKIQISANLNFEALAFMTENRSAADIKAICNQAGMNAFKRESGQEKRTYQVTTADLEGALSEFLSMDSQQNRQELRIVKKAVS